MKDAILGALVATVLLGIVQHLTNRPEPKRLEAQGRGPRIPPKPRSDKPTLAPEPIVLGGDSGATSSLKQRWEGSPRLS